MSDEYQRIEVIAGTARRRRWTGEQNLRIIEESCTPGETVSAVARRHGVAARLVFWWRRLMNEGGSIAVSSDQSVVGNARVRKLEERLRDLERLLGRKTLEVDIPRDALDKSASKKIDLAAAVAIDGRFAMKQVAKTLSVSRSNLHKWVGGTDKPRGPDLKAGDEVLLPLVRRFVDERPSHGYRRIAALVNRELARLSLPRANYKRVHRVMKRHALLLQRHTGRRADQAHDGKVIVMRSNLRRCSDGLAFTCWNGAVARVAFATTPMTARSSPGRPVPGSAAPWCAI